MPNIKCWECQKEIVSGKYYIFILGKKESEGGINNDKYCSVCAEKAKEGPWKGLIEEGNMTVIERDTEKGFDNEVSEFEEKWKKYNLFATGVGPTQERLKEITITWCQAGRQELEPYLQRPEIVEKAFGGYNHALQFQYYFAKSADDKTYKKEVVNKTINEIFDQPMPEINRGEEDNWVWPDTTKDIDYLWVKGYNKRLAYFSVKNNNQSLNSYCRALAIKEKELSKKETPPTNDKHSLKGSTEISGKIIVLSITIGILLILGVALFWLYWLYKKRKIK